MEAWEYPVCKKNSSDICQVLVNVGNPLKIKLVPDVAAIVPHVVHQPNITTPRGDILMSGRSCGDTQNVLISFNPFKANGTAGIV